ncbi:hypothetical protein [Microcella sp.]|uniref:hypothetical protein n=1 Tax=Microcella sp. TaxID=1913979 RepID=UPI00391BF7C5
MSRREQREQGALVYGAVPRANLMPPEVAMRRKESARRRGLIAASLAVVLVTIAGVAGAFVYAAAAEARLAEERRITDELLATQLEFTEVTLVRGQLQSITEVRQQLAGAEVLWRESLRPYIAVLTPAEVIESMTLASNSPALPALGTTGPLRAERVATVTMVIVTDTTPRPWLWYRDWQEIETFADASIDSITLLQDRYETTVTINLNELALSQRFGTDEEETE